MSGAPTDCCDASPEVLTRSILGQLDARTRVIAALGFVIAVISMSSLPLLGAALLLAITLVILSGQPFAALGHRLLHVEGFLLVLFVLLPFTTPGEELFRIGPLVASDAGVLRTVTVALKINTAVLGIFALLGSIEPAHLGCALARLGVPEKLVHLFLFTVRFVGVFRAEINRLLEAMRARAFRPRSNWHTWRTYGNLAGMMLIRSLERAERVDEAMRCRAFSGQFSLAADGTMNWRDGLFLVALFSVLVVFAGAGRLI
jgi:cobalt/nickel transport system permease protein